MGVTLHQIDLKAKGTVATLKRPHEIFKNSKLLARHMVTTQIQRNRMYKLKRIRVGTSGPSLNNLQKKGGK